MKFTKREKYIIKLYKEKIKELSEEIIDMKVKHFFELKGYSVTIIKKNEIRKI